MPAVRAVGGACLVEGATCVHGLGGDEMLQCHGGSAGAGVRAAGGVAGGLRSGVLGEVIGVGGVGRVASRGWMEGSTDGWQVWRVRSAERGCA